MNLIHIFAHLSRRLALAIGPAAYAQQELQIVGNFAEVHVCRVVIDQVLKKKVAHLTANAWPYFALMLAVLTQCMLVPSVVTALPHALGY